MSEHDRPLTDSELEAVARAIAAAQAVTDAKAALRLALANRKRVLYEVYPQLWTLGPTRVSREIGGTPGEGTIRRAWPPSANSR